MEDMRHIRPVTADDKKALSDICYSRAHELYGEILPKEVEDRIKKELKIISSESYEYHYLIEKEIVKNSGIGNLHFLGGTGANSFVAYLCGISHINPLKANYILPSEFFTGTMGNKKLPDFDLYVCSDDKDKVEDYLKRLYGKDHVLHVCTEKRIDTDEEGNAICGCADEIKFIPSKLVVIPSNIKNVTDLFPTIKTHDKTIINMEWRDLDGYVFDIDIFTDWKLDLLEVLKKKTGIMYKDIPISGISLQSLLLTDENGRYLLKGVFDEEYIENAQDILSMGTDYLFDDLVKLIGLIHGMGAWSDNGKELKDVIANREDCYDMFIKYGIKEQTAYQLTERIRKGTMKYYIGQDDEIMRKAGIPEWYINSCINIRYLYPRGKAIAEAVITWRLLYYKRYYTDVFYKILDEASTIK